MKKILKRVQFKRNSVFFSEKNKQIYKSLTNNNNLIKTVRWNADLNALKRLISSVQLTKRCIITGRKNIFNNHYRLSRIIFLKYSRKGLIPNLIKSTW